MLKKFILLIFISVGLTGCGYSPMNSNINTTNFMITKFEIKGDNQMNNLIERKIEKYLNNDSKNKYIIKVTTNLNKSPVAKDSTGKTTHIKIVGFLELNSKLEIQDDNELKKISFNESLTIKKHENNYEQRNYENIIIKNLADLLFDKLVFYLSKNP